jgi:hypothetical protein
VPSVDARPVLDTNRDGRIDQRDSPMAVGGFINGLRPVRLAYRLLEQAGVQIGTAPPARAPRQPAPAPREEQAEVAWSKPEFRDLLFSTRVTSDGRPVNPTSQVPEGVDTVYATFEYRGMKRGTPWSFVWIADNEEIIRQEDEWDDAPQGRKAVKVSNRKGVPPGEYHLVLGTGGSVALEGKVQVGNPIDETDSEVSGRIVDGRTQRPIADAAVIVLKPDAPLRTFLRNQDQSLVFTSCTSDSDGRFTLAKQLPKGQAYSLVVVARGYQPVAVDGALRLSSLAPEKADVGAIEMLPALELSGMKY